MSDSNRQFWLYILELIDGKYYIGLTKQKFPETRIQQHKYGFYSAQWVKKYGYKRTVDIQNLGEITEGEAKKIENETTLKYMAEYGKENVRGGIFNYSGTYRYRFGRFFRENDWEVLTVIIFLLLVILMLTIDKYNLI